MKKVGYARVSTSAQSLDKQMSALMEAGVAQENIFWDLAVSGKVNATAPGYLKLMECCEREPCEVWVVRLDRFGRSTVDLLQGVQKLADLGCSFRTVDNSLNYEPGNPTSKLMLSMLSSIAEFELSLIQTRMEEGKRMKLDAGMLIGRKPKFNRAQVKMIREEYNNGHGNIGLKSLAKKHQVSVNTIRWVVGLIDKPYPYRTIEDYAEAKYAAEKELAERAIS